VNGRPRLVGIHPRILDAPCVASLSDAAFRLHVRALAYAAEYRVDHLPASVAAQVAGGLDAERTELVAAGFWAVDAATGAVSLDAWRTVGDLGPSPASDHDDDGSPA